MNKLRRQILRKIIVIGCAVLCFAGHVKVSYAQESYQALIKRVQVNSQKSYDLLNKVSFKAHSKTYFYFSYNPFGVKMIPFLEEYYLEGIWMKPDSLRLNVTALRQVSPDTSDNDFGYGELSKEFPLPNPFHFTYDQAILGTEDDRERRRRQRRKDNENEDENVENDDDDDFMYVQPLHPFSANADSLYNYEIVGEISTSNINIVEIRVEPKQPSTPGVTGIFQIDKDNAIVVGSDYIFNEAAGFVRTKADRKRGRFSFTISFDQNHRINTKKSLYYSAFWMPVTIEEEMDVSILGIKAKLHRVLEFESYEVNPVSKGEIVVDKEIIYNRDPILEDSLFTPPPYPNRLSRAEEENIINKIENTFSSRNLFKELIDSESLASEVVLQGIEQKGERYLQVAGRLGSSIQYNRVEGFHLGYGSTFPVKNLGGLALSLNGGYGIEDKRWKWSVSSLYYLDSKKKLFVEGNIYSTLGYEEKRNLVSTGINTFSSLILKRDYRDHYYKKGGSFGIGYRLTDNLAAKLTGISHTEKNAGRNTKFSVFQNKYSFRTNPGIVEGTNRGIRGELLYRSYNVDGDINFEYSNDGTMNSDFSYSRIWSSLSWSARPTFHTKVFAKFTAGASSGDLPPQRWFDFGGKLPLNYNGRLRGVGYKFFTGDKMATGVLEYSINGNVLYDLGLKRTILKGMKFTLWIGGAWSELSQSNKQYAADVFTPTLTAEGGYNEYGIGIGDKLNIFRFDFIYNNISNNTFLFSFNVLR